MTGANVILGDFNSYLGDMKFESHLNAQEQGIWGPIYGDPSPLHAPAHRSGHQNANKRGRWLKNLLTSSELVVLNGRESNIAPYKNFPYTHIHRIVQNAGNTTTETIIDYALTNKLCKKYIRLCRVIQDSHEKVIGDNGAGMADHELILVEMILPRQQGGDKDARQPSERE